MGTVAPVVFEILEKTGAYVNRMFLQKNICFSKKEHNRNENNKQTSRCYGNSVSRAYFACIVKF